MENLNNVKSTLALKNLYFESENFRATGLKNTTEEAQVGFGILPLEVNGKDFCVKLECRAEVASSFKLQIIIVGEFVVEDEQMIERLMPNAVAILFPYLRSEVSLITTKPNVAPIVLPPVNINALLSRRKQD